MTRINQLLLLAGTLLSVIALRAEAMEIVRDGAAEAIIVLPATPSPRETLAAKELSLYIEKISGAKLSIASQTEIGGARGKILIGSIANQSLLEKLRSEKSDPASFVLSISDNRIDICGVGEDGTLFGAYELLEQLGVRWFMPGELGTVIPSQRTIEIANQQTIQRPSFSARWHGEPMTEGWAVHVRMGGPYFPGAHGIDLGPDSDFKSHPEFYSLIKGRRVGDQQLCVSNPEVIRRAVAQACAFFQKHPNEPWIGMGPNDGSGFCECEHCKSLDAGDWDPFASEVSMTDRYLWFFQQVLDGLGNEFADKKICFYAYHSYIRPPVRIKPGPRIVPALAPIELCRIHGMSNPLCPERSYYKHLMQMWGANCPEVYERGYWYNLADPALPFSMVHRMRDEIPQAHALGIKGWRTETDNAWASEMPSLYIAAKLMWKHDADVDALLDDFCEKFFGPAQKPMREYLQLIDSALRDGDYHTGASWDVPKFYPTALREKARAFLQTAVQSCPADSIHQKRVAMLRMSFDYLEHFIQMLEARNAFDFACAAEHLDAMHKLQAISKQSNETRLLGSELTLGFLDRFWGNGVKKARDRTTDGNALIAKFEDVWSFFLDPFGVGEAINLQRPDAGGNWRKVHAYSESWSDQGLRYQRGRAWYRQQFNVPDGPPKRLFLWFGGVDEKAKVWIDGKLIGISPGVAFEPFELDAGELSAGAHTLTVCVNNQQVNELGTGGIVSPVFLYAPKDGKDARLQNLSPLSSEFP